MKCNDILLALEELCPVEYREEWDNVGLLVGDLNRDVQTVYLAVDATSEVIDQAIAAGADLLLTHHPLIFTPLKKIVFGDIVGERVIKLIQADVSYIAMHTNFDVMGMADAVADRLHIGNREVLSVTYEDDISSEGIGRVGDVLTSQPMNAYKYAEFIAGVFGLSDVRIWGDGERPVNRVAVVPGSGAEYYKEAVSGKADVLVTGDVTHHKALDAIEAGITVIDAGHYGLEKIFTEYMRDFLTRSFPNLQVIVERSHEPFVTI